MKRLTSMGTYFFSAQAGSDNHQLWKLSEAQDLGEIDFHELPKIDLSTANGAYLVTTSHSGYLTVDATFDPAARDVTLSLLNDQGQVIDEVTDTDGYLRIDHIATASATAYEIQLTGTNTDVDLRICNLVSQAGEKVEVFDTEGDDAFLFAVSETFDVTVNGVGYHFGDAVEFAYRSEAGVDTVELVDSDGDDTLTVSAAEVGLSGTTGGGKAYSVTASGFPVVHGYAKAGGNDVAQFVGSERSERVKAYEGLVKLMGGGLYGRAKFFETVEVEMGGGKDAGVMVASAGSARATGRTGESWGTMSTSCFSMGIVKGMSSRSRRRRGQRRIGRGVGGSMRGDRAAGPPAIRS